MTQSNKTIKSFTEKAEAVHTTVRTVGNLNEAYTYAIDVCLRKETRIQFESCPADKSSTAGKVIAVPSLNDDERQQFMGLAGENDLTFIHQDLRSYLGGIEVAFTFADYGIEETGSIVLNSSDENLRIATMVSEDHIAVLPMSKIVKDAFEIEDVLTEWMKQSNYTAFITGPSRTADIERVLATGVHGPLNLHILLLEED